jgi:predicted transcriptional regulator
MITTTEMGYIKISISIPEETKTKLEQIAKKEMRSISNMIAYLVEHFDTK